MAGKVKRLEGDRPSRESECPRQCVGLIVSHRQGQPVPPYDAEDALPCRNCGGKHVLLLEVVVVDGDGEEINRAAQGETGQA
jgi:hypothetical protein